MECYLQYKDGPPVAEYKSHYDFIIQKLKSQPTDAVLGNRQVGVERASVLTGEVAPKWKTTGEQHGRRRSGDFEKREVSRFRVNGTIQHDRRRTGDQAGGALH